MGCLWAVVPRGSPLWHGDGPSKSNIDDFNLEDALEPTKKPSVPQKPAVSDDYFNLEDALSPVDPSQDLPAHPGDTGRKDLDPKGDGKPGGNFDDSDLYDGSLPRGRDGGGSNGQNDANLNNGGESEASQGAIAGIISAVAATVIGAVSSFIAYQKKKLCFKQSDQENVNMESHRGAQSEPPVQRTLLEN
ncbi:CD99 antigen isoform X2 [Nothoprocta perdicaria]|uniref:CD99 antigen isoform X2 n=1 Tax=Nothoprocta perdicaria TaxID=30464 RepID=UPI000E1B7F74|nr:CD99 antigen isoform X2 [Nothoprocta perdicaria]